MNSPNLKNIFSYDAEFSNLRGFPTPELVKSFGNVLYRSPILKRHRTKTENVRAVSPAFPVEYVEKRQEFFRQADRISCKLEDNFFEKFDEFDNILVRDYGKNKQFVEICTIADEVRSSLRKELNGLAGVNEAKRILQRLDNFGSDLEELLKTMRCIDKTSTFYVNSERGTVSLVSSLPAGLEETSYMKSGDDNIENASDYILKEIFTKAKFKLKKDVLAIGKQIKLNFKEKLIDFVRKEFRCNADKDNLRRDYEILKLSLGLRERYCEFLKRCEVYNQRINDVEIDYFDDEEGPNIEPQAIPEAIYPVFGNKYDVAGLFPLKLMDRWRITPQVPINFKANSNEKKFLIAGLHSGGKSFFLENIILTSLVGQIGLNIPAKKLVLPKYNHLHYFRSDKTDRDAGSLETELRALNNIIKTAAKGDLIVLDEFLDSTSPDIANWLGADILERLLSSQATVFVASHRNTNYEQLQKQGWIVLSPGHTLKKGEVIPTYTLSRGIPDEKVNRMYVKALYSDLSEDD